MPGTEELAVYAPATTLLFELHDDRTLKRAQPTVQSMSVCVFIHGKTITVSRHLNKPAYSIEEGLHPAIAFAGREPYEAVAMDLVQMLYTHPEVAAA